MEAANATLARVPITPRCVELRTVAGDRGALGFEVLVGHRFHLRRPATMSGAGAPADAPAAGVGKVLVEPEPVAADGLARGLMDDAVIDVAADRERRGDERARG